MRPLLLFPVLTALIGFGIGWLAKPAANPPAPAPPTATDTPPPRPRPSTPELPPAPPPADLPPPSPTSFTTAAQRELANQPLDAAKLQRLAELLSLTPDQISSLARLAADSEAAASATDFIENLDQRGRFILAAVAKLLTPEQNTAFLSLVDRTRDNAIEAGAQRRLASIIEKIDLTPHQRRQVAVRFRNALRDEIAQLPPQLSILSDTSPLPLGPGLLPAASILAFSADLPSAAPPEPQVDLSDILTPAQNAQLEALSNLRKNLLDAIPGMPR